MTRSCSGVVLLLDEVMRVGCLNVLMDVCVVNDQVMYCWIVVLFKQKTADEN
mgnify:CR=1 FL=1